jgi:integrase/recombinase XerC
MKTPEETNVIAAPATAAEASQELQLPSPTSPASSAGADPAPGKRKNYKALPDQILGRPAVAIAAADVAGLDLQDLDRARGPARRRDPELVRLVDAYVESRTTLNTRLAYELALQDFLKALKIENAGEVLAVRADQVVRYRNALEKRGLAPSTINQRLAAVRGLYRRMLKEGRIQHNPADPELVEGLQVSDVSRTEGLTVGEVSQVLATCDGTLRGLRDRALVLTLFYQGLRRSEASKLCYRDITTRRGLLEVKGAKNNPYDTIRLKPEVKRAIEDYLEVLGRELRRRETRPEDPVFVSVSIRSFGRRLAPSSINNLVKARVKLAGITRRATCHSFRHACTTAALAAGVPLHQVQRHLRHKDVRTTLRYDREREARKNPTLEMMPALG